MSDVRPNRKPSVVPREIEAGPVVAIAPSLERLTDIAYRRLRQSIITCDLPPSSEVTEAQLAVRFGLGKAATRAALIKLSQDKAVTPLPRRGYQIAPVRLRDVHEIFQLRAMLEPEAVRLAASRVDLDALRRLDGLCAAGYSPGDRAGEVAYLQANRGFHSTITRACGNERLADLVDDIVDQMQRFFHIGLIVTDRRAEMRQQHSGMLEALIRRDGDAAAGFALSHIETMRGAVIDGVLSSNGLMDVNIGGAAKPG